VEDYTYDPNNPGWWYTGDPSIESNWIYQPPGEQAPVDAWNAEPDGSGGYTMYPPGEVAPIDAPDFSLTSETYPGTPTSEQQTAAVGDYISQWGLDPGQTAEAWQGPGGERYTKDFEGNVFDEMGQLLGNDRPTQTETAEPPPPPPSGGPQTGGAPPPGAVDANGNVFVAGVGLVKPDRMIYFQGRWMTAMEAADLQHRQNTEATQRSVQGQERVFTEGQRRFNEEQAQRREEAAGRERTTRETAELNAKTARENAQLSAMVNRQKLAADMQLQSDDLAARKEAQEKSQKLALIQALLAASRGPNGPANRAMALTLMQSLGINTAAASAGAGTTAVNPLGIPPATWDAMSPAAQQLLLDAFSAQGGEPADFAKVINDQRPGGRPGGASRPRFAALAGA